MPKRIKPEAVVVADLKQAEAAVAQVAALDRRIKAIELEMQETLDRTKLNAKREMEPLLAERKELSAAVQGYATVNRAELFAKKKSLEFPVGTIGFRKCTKLVAQAKVTMGMVLEKLRDYGHEKAIKVSESVNKEAMREWSDEKLETVGMRRSITDQFYIEIALDELGES